MTNYHRIVDYQLQGSVWNIADILCRANSFFQASSRPTATGNMTLLTLSGEKNTIYAIPSTTIIARPNLVDGRIYN